MPALRFSPCTICGKLFATYFIRIKLVRWRLSITISKWIWRQIKITKMTLNVSNFKRRRERERAVPKTKMIMHKIYLNDVNKSTLTWRCTIAWRFFPSDNFLPHFAFGVHLYFLFCFPLCLSSSLTQQLIGRATAPRASAAQFFWVKFVYHCYDFAFECYMTLLFAAYVKEFYFSQLNILRHHHIKYGYYFFPSVSIQ